MMTIVMMMMMPFLNFTVDFFFFTAACIKFHCLFCSMDVIVRARLHVHSWEDRRGGNCAVVART